MGRVKVKKTSVSIQEIGISTGLTGKHHIRSLLSIALQ